MGWFAVAAAMAVGCKKGPVMHVTQAPAAKLPAGWETAKSRDGSVSIGVPGGWRYGADRTLDILGDVGSSTESQGDLNNPERQKLMEGMRQDDAAEERKTLERMEKKGIVVNVINGSKPIPGEARTRFYVLRTHSESPVDWLAAADKERRHYAFPPKPQEVDLPIGKAWRLSATDTLRDGGTLHQISYVVAEGGDTYTLRFVTEEGQDTIKSIADDVAKSWRVTPKI